VTAVGLKVRAAEADEADINKVATVTRVMENALGALNMFIEIIISSLVGAAKRLRGLLYGWG